MIEFSITTMEYTQENLVLPIHALRNRFDNH